MGVQEIPAATVDRLAAVRRRLAEIDEMARAEQAMADGCPTVDQELLLMSVGSLAHRARRHRSGAVRQRGGLLRRWLRRPGEGAR
jgi:hypothetical protein